MKNKIRLLILISSIVIGLAAIGLALWFFARPQAATACQDVTVYQDANYAGKSACLAPGQYTKSNLQSKGISDNSISSIKMLSGFKVTIYDGDNYSGESTSLAQSISDLRTLRINHFNNWNDRISSLKIVYTVCPAPLSETRTVSCPSGQTGSITETRTRGAIPTCTWGDWKQTSNTCATPPAKPKPTVNLKVNGSNGPISVDYNSSVKLSWTASNTDSCTASDGWSGNKDDNGEETTSPLTATTTFTLTCTRNGSGSDSVTVNVGAAPEPTPEPTPTPTPTPEPAPTPTPTPEPTPAENQPSSGENEAPIETPVVETPTEPSGTVSPATPAGETENKTNIWIYLVVGLIMIGGGIYGFIKFRGAQVTGEDLLRQAGNEPTEEKPVEDLPEPPVQPSPPPAPKPDTITPLPPSVPAATLPPEKTDDLDID